jgi:hypothetical protein
VLGRNKWNKSESLQIVRQNEIVYTKYMKQQQFTNPFKGDVLRLQLLSEARILREVSVLVEINDLINITKWSNKKAFCLSTYRIIGWYRDPRLIVVYDTSYTTYTVRTVTNKLMFHRKNTKSECLGGLYIPMHVSLFSYI